MRHEGAFSLRKWYLDLVTAAGDALVAYHATLRLRGAAVHYAALLLARRGEAATTRRSLRAAAPPVEDGGVVRHRHPRLGLDGTWTREAAPIRERLQESRAGAVDWECLMPRATAAVTLGDGTRLEGTGYVERLELSIAPWKIPIRELRWGRWHGPAGAMVWIDWVGPAPLTRVYLDGERMRDAVVSDDAVSGPTAGVVLRLTGRESLREGALGSTVLARLPALSRLLTPWTLGIVERKWLGRGSLESTCGARAEGWAVSERVTFGPGRP